ncbi:flagellar hook-length control protein FliK [Pannonibacter carbonis]|uniref:flagellar hook-length control protein FliK n=1 Tax=Pannonibacter carbonis TaxID=2067569 RepID=UPI000D10D76C|nr:flagellar hook-length control protein FliK [Pannonibacter carbonis]
MAVSTSAVMQAPAPVAGRGQESAGDGAGNGFSDVLRDVSQPKDQDASAGQPSSAGSEPESPASTDGALQLQDDAAGLLKLLVTPAAGIPDQGAAGDANALAALLGLAPSLAVAAAPAASPNSPGPQGPLRSGAPAFAEPQAGAGPLVSTPVAGGAPAAGQAAVASAGTSPAAAAPVAGNLSGLDDAGLFARFAVAPEEVSVGVGDTRSGDSQRAMAAIGQVRVLREETHFAPSLRLSPLQQVGEAIIGALSEPRPAPSAQGPAAGGLFSTGSTRPMVKVLEIQLQPMELGSVKVSLRLIGDRVEVVMSAQNPDTAELLRQDRQLLDQMLRAVGQKADTITIQSAGDDRPMFQVNGSLQGQQSGWTAQSGDGGPAWGAGTGGDSEPQNGGGDQTHDGPLQEDQEDAGHAAHSDSRSDRSGAVYL